MPRVPAAALAAAALLLPLSAAAAAPLLRSDLAALPESIRRESLAAVDRACDSLRAALPPRPSVLPRPPRGEDVLPRPPRGEDVLPRPPRGVADLFPAAALADSAAPDPLFAAALSRCAATLAQPWDSARARDAAYLLLGAARAGAEPPAGLVDRLAKTDLSALGVADRALALVALDSFGADTAAGWDALARRPVPAAPTLADVAAAALARVARARRLRGPDAPMPDVLAHARWLAARLHLGFGGADDPDHEVTPENALLCAILASALPRRDLAADPALFPWDWRNHLANRLVVRQAVDPDTGEAFWDGGSSGAPRLLATTQAVLALRLLAQ